MSDPPWMRTALLGRLRELASRVAGEVVRLLGDGLAEAVCSATAAFLNPTRPDPEPEPEPERPPIPSRNRPRPAESRSPARCRPLLTTAALTAASLLLAWWLGPATVVLI